MSEEVPQTPRQPSLKLQDKDKMQLWTFLQGCKETIEREEVPLVRIVKMVKESIGLDVNKDHVRRALHLCGIKVFRKPVRSNQYLKLRPQVEALQVRFERLEQRVGKAEADLAAVVKLVEETAKNLEARWRIVNGQPVRK